MPNAKDYTGGRKNFLVYGAPGAGKSTSLLTLPGRKFAYIFDPSGLESFAGHDIDYELFVPKLTLSTGQMSKKSGRATVIKPDPKTYLYFEQDFESKVDSGFFKDYDIVAFESLTTLMQCLMAYILDVQGRGNKPPEMQDYWHRADGLSNIMRVATSADLIVYASAHVTTAVDEVTKRIETSLAMSDTIKTGLPLLFSEIIHMYAERDRKGGVVYTAQIAPDKRVPIARTSLQGQAPELDVTVDFKRKSLIGQGLGRYYPQLKERNKDSADSAERK